MFVCVDLFLFLSLPFQSKETKLNTHTHINVHMKTPAANSSPFLFLFRETCGNDKKNYGIQASHTKNDKASVKIDVLS